ncbi:MAG: PilT/PilU family type 4a pilus ATPase [Victivallales bacterium]|nr:PilT/PilU family type 4a pilus ATPase [Victivallales bacterium]
MKKESITKEIDWFCHHVVSDRMMTKDSCVAVLDAIEENGLTPNLDLFVGVVKDNQLCEGPAEQVAKQLDKLASMSKEEARVFGPPSRSVFDENSPVMPNPPMARPQPAAPTPQPAPAPTPQPAAAQQPSAQTTADKPKSQERPAPSMARPTIDNSPAWTLGWPQLSKAEGMDREAARNLLNDFLHKAREANCSDIHISTGAVPFVRRYKQLFLLPDQEVLSAAAAEALNFAPLNEEQQEHFNKHRDLDYGYNITASDRYRTNVMMQRLGVAGSYRVIDTEVRPISEIGFKNPEVIEKLSSYSQGLILVTGPAGSGKSTTLSALVDHINRNRHDHIITIEDPIEVVHNPIGCSVSQRELKKHTKSFGNALRAALREDPDVIVIGELRDLETIEMAVHSSETGHLVIGTLHTSSAADTMNRILDVFPHGQQAQIRAMVAESLKGVICQQLLPNADGTNVVLAVEILLGTLAVSNLIREGKTYQIESTIQTSKHLGMISMEQSHFELYMNGKRSYEQTLPYIKNNDLKRQMQQQEAMRLAGGGGAGGAAPRPAGMGAASSAPSTPASRPTPPPEPPKKRRGFFGF